jgi:hypothetical protein
MLKGKGDPAMRQSWLIHLYRSLLRLYPPGFKAEFGDEMEEVFAYLLSEALNLPRRALLGMLWTELWHLPAEALRQHLTRRTGDPAKSEAARDGWEGPARPAEMLIALTVFVLPVIALWLKSGQNLSTGWLAGILTILFFLGVQRGFPRWSLPYFGLALSACSFLFIFQWAADLVAPSVVSRLIVAPHSESTHLLLQVFWAGLMWLSLFVLVFVVLGIMAAFRRFRAFLGRIREDWTLVSYILYAGAMFMLALAFNQYRYEGPYAMASTFCLITGAWLYLRSSQRWKRTLSLLAGLTLAMWTAAVGLWSGAPWETWSSWQSWGSLEYERWFEGLRTILAWGWMVVAICAPALLRFLPGPEARKPSGDA